MGNPRTGDIYEITDARPLEPEHVPLDQEQADLLKRLDVKSRVEELGRLLEQMPERVRRCSTCGEPAIATLSIDGEKSLHFCGDHLRPVLTAVDVPPRIRDEIVAAE